MPRKPKSDVVTMVLTEEDLAPIRKHQAAHEQAAAQFKKGVIKAEMARKEIGEVGELSVPQVVAFDLSAAFSKAAEKKAREAGLVGVSNLQKTAAGVWSFQAVTEAGLRRIEKARQVEIDRMLAERELREAERAAGETPHQL